MPLPNDAAWVVTNQREDWQLDAQNQGAHGMVVTFETASGAIGSVFVPKAEYSLEKVRQLVAEKAATMNQVSELRG